MVLMMQVVSMYVFLLIYVQVINCHKFACYFPGSWKWSLLTLFKLFKYRITRLDFCPLSAICWLLLVYHYNVQGTKMHHIVHYFLASYWEQIVLDSLYYCNKYVIQNVYLLKKISCNRCIVKLFTMESSHHSFSFFPVSLLCTSSVLDE